MRLLSVDFGTSNTVVALAVDGQAPRTLTFDTSPLLPSAVFLDTDGTITVGREAQRKARLDPARYEPNPKRRIDDGDVLLGDTVVKVVDLIAAVLRTVATEVRRQLGGAAPDEIRLTHPAQWGAPRQNTLITAARAAGLGTNLVLIPEPVAAAAQYTRLPGRELPPGGSVAVYDLGGGTLDIAVVGRSHQQFHVLAEAGLSDLGGLDFDQAVLDQVGRTASATDPGRWQQILRPADSSARRAARALADDVRAAKETLSGYPQTDVALPDPFDDVHLTRSEFEGLIRPNLMRSIEVLQSTLRSAGVGAERVTGIFLVGGSSRIPLVATLIADQLGVVPVALDQPETAVALGALLVPVQREGNRTTAVGGPSSGAFPVGPPSRPNPSHTGPVRPASGAHQPSGAQPPPGAVTGSSYPGQFGSGPPAQGKRRSPLLIGGVVVAVVAVLVAAFLVIKPFGGGTADPTPTDPPTTGVSTTGVSNTGAPSTGSSASTGRPTPADPSQTGFGPGKLLSKTEFDFLGPSSDKLENCGDNTASFNKLNPPQPYQAPRIIRCEIPEDDTNGLYGRTLLFLFSTPDPAAAQTLLAQITTDRKRDGTFSVQTKGGQIPSAAGTLNVVVADHLAVFGTDSSGSGDGVPAIAWGVDSGQYVGVIIGVQSSSANDLLDFFDLSYRPR
ncbi:Hsp70 family protein [Nakamurella sp. A5-74]|uniref:Hsp70 family protein n=1 Tax=Nakamurella sp. A5-74 TaxID=3158264 RepID=A0AAU8DQB7_9ACTN